MRRSACGTSAASMPPNAVAAASASRARSGSGNARPVDAARDTGCVAGVGARRGHCHQGRRPGAVLAVCCSSSRTLVPRGAARFLSVGGAGFRRVSPAQRSSPFDELGTPLREVTFVVLDLETTGGAHADDAITEIGAVKVRGGERIGELATLVDPGTGVPPSIVASPASPPRWSAARRRSRRCCRRCWSSSRARCSWRTTPRSTPGSSAPPASGTGRRGRGRRCSARRGSPGPSCRARRRPACGWARWPGCSAPPPRPTTGRSPMPGPPSRCCTGCWSGSATSACRACRSCSRWRAVASAHRPTTAQRRKRTLAEAVPSAPGVYLFRGPRDEVLYVGTSGDLRRRVRSYFTAGERRAPRARHGGARRAGRHGRVRARAGGGGAGAAADRGPPSPLQPPFPRPAPRLVGHHHRGGVPPAVGGRHRAGGGGGPFRSRQAAVAAVETVLDAVPVRACTQRIAAHGARASPCALHELGRCAAPCAGCRPRPIRARRRRRDRPVRRPRRRRVAPAARRGRGARRPRAVRDGGPPPRSARRARARPRSGPAAGGARGRRRAGRGAARRARRLGDRGGAPRPPRRGRGRRARHAADAGDRRAPGGRPGGAAGAGAAARRRPPRRSGCCTAGSPPAAPGSCTPSRRGPSPPAAPRPGRGGRSAPGRSWWTTPTDGHRPAGPTGSIRRPAPPHPARPGAPRRSAPLGWPL